MLHISRSHYTEWQETRERIGMPDRRQPSPKSASQLDTGVTMQAVQRHSLAHFWQYRSFDHHQTMVPSKEQLGKANRKNVKS